MSSDETGSPSRIRAYAELLRLPNIFTAMADVAMGFLVVQAILGPRDFATLGLLIAASGMIYAAGVVLNDVFDQRLDAEQRPERPLPSGRISPAAASWLGWELLLLGTTAAWGAGYFVGHVWPGIVAAVLVVCVVAYDAILKRTPLGPLAMGACRMLNVLLGMSVVVEIPDTAHWLIAGGIGTYIVGVTWFARTEASQSNRWSLALALLVMLAGIVLLAQFPRYAEEVTPLIRQQPARWYVLVALLGALTVWRGLRAVVEPTPERVQTAVQNSILSLIFLDAAICYVVRGPYPATAILLLLIPAVTLGRWIRST